MKKVVLSILQVVVFVILYEVIAYGISIIISLLANLADSYEISRKIVLFLMNTRTGEGIFQTIIPLLIATAVIEPFKLIFKKVRVNIFAFCAILAYLAYLYISKIIESISYYGLFTYETLIQLWILGIMGAVFIFGLLEKVDFTIKKKDDDVEN